MTFDVKIGHCIGLRAHRARKAWTAQRVFGERYLPKRDLKATTMNHEQEDKSVRRLSRRTITSDDHAQLTACSRIQGEMQMSRLLEGTKNAEASFTSQQPVPRVLGNKHSSTLGHRRQHGRNRTPATYHTQFVNRSGPVVQLHYWHLLMAYL